MAGLLDVCDLLGEQDCEQVVFMWSCPYGRVLDGRDLLGLGPPSRALDAFTWCVQPFQLVSRLLYFVFYSCLGLVCLHEYLFSCEGLPSNWGSSF